MAVVVSEPVVEKQEPRKVKHEGEGEEEEEEQEQQQGAYVAAAQGYTPLDALPSDGGYQYQYQAWSDDDDEEAGEEGEAVDANVDVDAIADGLLARMEAEYRRTLALGQDEAGEATAAAGVVVRRLLLLVVVVDVGGCVRGFCLGHPPRLYLTDDDA